MGRSLTGSSRSLEDQVFEKAYPHSPLDHEFEKALRMWELFEYDARIDCPRPLEIDVSTRTIRYSHLSSDQTLTEEYTRYLQGQVNEERFDQLLYDIGTMLARIHKELTLSTRTTWELPSTFEMAARRAGFEFPVERLRDTPHAFLHCDSGFGNIHCLVPEDDARPYRIRLYDPSPNNHSTFAPDQFASVYLDLGSVLASLNGRLPLASYPSIRWERMAHAKERFLVSYERATGFEIDRNLAELCGFATAFASFSKWRGQGVRRFLAISTLYNRFKGNVDWIEPLRDLARAQ